ncbi:hypothetical protein SLA2020_461480 [Shorea laevis]
MMTLASQPQAIQPMQDFHIWVSLDHYIGHRNLHLSPITADFTAHSSNLRNLDLRRKTSGHVGKQRNRSRVTVREIRGTEVVEPENAADAAGSVVESEFEESAGFVVAEVITPTDSARETGMPLPEKVSGSEGEEGRSFKCL